MVRQLHALRLTTRKCSRALPQPQITESHILEDLQLGQQPRYLMKEPDRFANRQLKHLVDIQHLVLHFKDAALITCALTLFADQLDVCQKLHLDGDCSVALTHLAPATGDVEREMSRCVTSPSRLWSCRKRLANQVEGFDIGHRIGSRRPSDWRLVHQAYVAYK